MDGVSIPPMLKIAVGVVAGFLAAKGLYPNAVTEEDKKAFAWVFLGVAVLIIVMFETIIGILFLVGLVGSAVWMIPYVIRLFGQTAKRTKDEIDDIRNHTRREPTAPALPDLRRDIDRLVDEDGNVSEELVRELIEYYGHARNDRHEDGEDRV